jgi:hypothetical protein
MKRAIAALITLLVFSATPGFARQHQDEVQAPRAGGPERGGSHGIQVP